MSDETQIPQWARDAGLVTVVVTAVAGAVRAVVTGVVRLVGSRRDRSADLREAASEWQEIASEARRQAAECEARGREQQAAIDGLRDEIHVLRDQLGDLRSAHAGCPARIADLELRVAEHRQTIERLERQSTPPAPGEER